MDQGRPKRGGCYHRTQVEAWKAATWPRAFTSSEHRQEPKIMAGIYLDPRLLQQLSNENQSKGKDIVEAIQFKDPDDEDLIMVPNESRNGGSSSTATTSTSDGAQPPSKWEKLIGSYNVAQPPTQSVRESRMTIRQQMLHYEAGSYNEAITHATNPTNFWNKRAMNDDDPLHELAVVALSIITCPVTEVTAERLFSLLGFVFNHLRTCLKIYAIDDILFCMWNKGRLVDVEAENPPKKIKFK